MAMRLKKATTFLALIAVALIYGCAAQTEQAEIIWPKPPDEPRIKYVRDIYGLADFNVGSKALDIILGADTDSNLQKPMSVHAASDGRIFITDTALGDVLYFDPVGKKATTFTSANASKLLQKPIGVAVDPVSGNVFVADSSLDTVVLFDKKGKYVRTVTPKTGFKQPTGITIDVKNRRLFVTDTHLHNITVFNADTFEVERSIGKRGTEEGDFNFPSHIAVDDKGFLYVTDTMNARVQIFDQDGRFLRAFGKFGDGPGMFARPKGIALDSEGHIYVVDAAFNNVQIFNDEGQVLMHFSNYGSGAGEMILPAGIAVDSDDYIYVVDSWNARLVVFEYMGDKFKARKASAPKQQ